MTIRNLDFLFNPKSVALIGASKQPGSVGAVLARNLLRSGFDGPVMPVNPKYGLIESTKKDPRNACASGVTGRHRPRENCRTSLWCIKHHGESS
jgi:hypothetical protein